LNQSNLDMKVTAICECEREKRVITYRQLKNKWPICDCRKPMIIKMDDDEQ